MRAAPHAVHPADDQLGILLFDRLAALDESGNPRPSLALDWQHDAERKRWQFRLRSGVKFHDGTALGAAAVAEALQATASGETVTFQFDRPRPALLFELAGPAGSIFRRAPDGAPIGSGPFRITTWDPGKRAVLVANEYHRAGRPFLDGIEIDFGKPSHEQAIDLEVGKADIVELSPVEMRRLSQRGILTWSSRPSELWALVPALKDPRVREAVALAIDRGAIQAALFHKQGNVAGGLLPQWLGGYAFLFPAGRDLERARQRSAEAKAGPLLLEYEPTDPAARLVADRIAVNTRDAGLSLRVAPQGSSRADLKLVRRQIASLDPAKALAELATSLGLAAGGATTLEEAYEVERALVESFQVIPLVHLPRIYGLGGRVRNWRGWRLDEVWLEEERP